MNLLESASHHRPIKFYGPIQPITNQWGMTTSNVWKKDLNGQIFQFAAEGVIEERYRLDSEIEQNRLYKEYLSIKTRRDAQEWLLNNGLPGLIPNQENEWEYAEENIYGMIDSANTLRILLEISRVLNIDTVENRNSLSSLAETVQPVFWNGGTSIEGKYSPVEAVVRFKNIRSVYQADGKSLRAISIKSITFPQKLWIKKKKDCLRKMAISLLEQSVNVMLFGVSPRVEWRPNSVGVNSLFNDFGISCPWHAIANEFLKEVQGRPNICPHPKCKNPLTDMRSDAGACWQDKCKQYVKRQKRKLRQRSTV